MRMAWWISLVSVSSTCWPGWTWASGSRAGIAWCAASAASSAVSAAWVSALMVLIIALVTTVAPPGGGVQCAAGGFGRLVGGLLGRVGHQPGRVVVGGAVGVVRVQVEVDAGVAVV